MSASKALAAALACVLPAAASAAVYGDTAYSPSVVAHCTFTTALSVPVSVSVNSRIFVSARGAYSPGGNANNNAYIHVELRNGADTTTLAASQQAFSNGSDYNYTPPSGSSGGDKGFLDSNGLLHTGTNPSDAAASIYVAAPGSYLLQMKVRSDDTVMCNEVGGGSGVFYDVTLTYLLLSSAFDRIFADGFQAMLGAGTEAAVLA